MFITRTDTRDRGATYNQHHGSKQNRDHSGREHQPQSEDDAIEISLTTLATAAENEPAAPTLSLTDGPPEADGEAVPHIDIKV